MTPPPTTNGKLSDLARHVVVPSGLTSTGWPAVRDKCRELGVRFDPWQDGAGRIILSKRSDGTYATSIGGVVISIPRQVGKTFLVGAIVFALCLLFPGITVIWTAHRLRTAGETFASMQAFAARKKIKPFVEQVFRGSGEEEIRFRNGSRILFGARERGFGRGFTLVDVLVFDEAQILTENAIDDMVPATNQAPNPLLLFTGTPPKPTDPGEVFTAKRDKALSGESDDMAYIEFSADEGANPDDRKQWAKANPSYPKRTPANAVLRMRENLTLESFLREALGIWSSKGAGKWLVVPKADWFERADALHESPEAVDYALDVDTNDVGEEWCSIGASDGEHVELVTPPEAGPGLGWVVAAVVAKKEQGVLTEIVLDPKGPAGRLLEPLERAGVKVRAIKPDEFVQACGQLVDAVVGGQVVHLDQAVLNRAAAGVVKRDVGDGAYRFSRTRSNADIGPLNAVAIARWAALNRPAPKKPMFAIT